MKNYLDFENDIKNIENDLKKLKDPYSNDGLTEVDTNKIALLERELDEKIKSTYSDLNSWQKTLLARHEERPKSKYYIEKLFTNFINLSGDRSFGEDQSVLVGFASFEDQSVLVIGQEKGDDLNSRIKHNFGMMKPEGYRKCIRLMKLAEKFNVPIISLIDTPGAYPGTGSEERGVAESIAKSIETCMSLKVANISIIIGEGGSGGAIALASVNRLLMLENAIYSVISPEGCATILWRDPKKTLEAASAMKLSAIELFELGIIDGIIKEKGGGAHRDKVTVLNEMKNSIRQFLNEFSNLNSEEILNQRKEKFLSIGRKKGFKTNKDYIKKIKLSKDIYINLKKQILSNKFYLYSVITLPILFLFFLLMLL